MKRNSLGQVIVNESGSSVVSILALERSITLNQYNRFLLNNKEFTELVPTIDKDALIRELTNQVDTLNNSVNSLTTDLKGGFLVSATESQFAAVRDKPNAITYNGQQVYENIGFNDDSTTPNFNSRQSNGQKFWNIPDKVARIFLEANSEGQYTMKANIKYRIKYIGTSNITNITKVELGLQFWKNGIAPLGTEVRSGVLDLTKTSYAPNESSNQEFSISIQRTGGLGEITTDTLYLATRYFSVAQNGADVASNFLVEVLPGSTFSLLPV